MNVCTSNQESILFTPDQAAEFFGCSKQTIYRLVRRGALGARRVGRLIRFNNIDINEYLDQARTQKGR